MNVNGRLGADAVQRMQQAQQANAPRVESQNEETSQTVRKPLSQSEVAAMMKGNVGEPTSNVNTDIVTTQEAQAADHDNNEAPKLNTQWKDYGSLRRNGKKGDFCLPGINVHFALAESKEKNESEENKKLIDKNLQNLEDKMEIKKTNITKEEKKDEDNKIINKEIKLVKYEEKNENNNIIENNDNINIEQKVENKEKKETKIISARERLNKLKEKKEKIHKLNFSEIISQTNNNNNA